MKRAFKLGLLAVAACWVWYHFNRNVNPRDEDIDKLIHPDDTLPYNAHRIDSGRVDTSSFVPRDTTPYEATYIDIN